MIQPLHISALLCIAIKIKTPEISVIVQQQHKPDYDYRTYGTTGAHLKQSALRGAQREHGGSVQIFNLCLRLMDAEPQDKTNNHSESVPLPTFFPHGI